MPEVAGGLAGRPPRTRAGRPVERGDGLGGVGHAESRGDTSLCSARRSQLARSWAVFLPAGSR
eukprot:3452813-Lingulodinium_polyedra.AAC.1